MRFRLPGVLLLCASLILFAPRAQAAPAKPQTKLEVVPIDAAALQKEIASRKGRVVIVDFWATWCDGCVEKLPELLKLHKEYSARGLDLMLVSADDLEDAQSKVAPFLKTQNVDFKTWILREEIFGFIKHFDPDLKSAFALPRTYIYNRDGKRAAVLDANSSSVDLEKTIASLLKTPK